VSLTKVRFSMIKDGVINIVDYGADPTGATDSTAAIQNAINAANAAGGGTVFIPNGTFNTNAWIYLKSNVTIEGTGSGSKVISSDNRCFFAFRDNAPDASTPFTNIQIKNIYCESAYDAGSLTPTGYQPCIELEFTDNSIIDSVEIGKADDACILISGYRKGIVSKTESLTNPDYGFAKNNIVKNCIVSGGYLGIELIGGAQCNVVNNTILDATLHGIRNASGGWNSACIGNTVVDCGGISIYMDYTKNLRVIGNYALSTRASGPASIQWGGVQDCVISNNIGIGNIGDNLLFSGARTDYPERISVIGNNIDGEFNLLYSTDIFLTNNFQKGTQTAFIANAVSGVIANNLFGDATVFSLSDLTSIGGDLYAHGNTSSTSDFRPVENQFKIIGASNVAPSSGTFTVGDIVFNTAPAAGGTIGWVCVTAGTPGTWKTFGTIAV